MTGGSGTLSGGAGNDTFNLAYSAKQKISAVIEDIDPTKDKIVITYGGDTAPQLTHSISGGDVIWTDDKGYFNLTLKGSSDASDYYEGTPNDYIWDILWITNRERETEKLEPLTLSQGLMDGAAIRAPEIIETNSHTRPDGSDCFTAVKKSYWNMGENLAWGYTSPEEAMVGWMNSPGHRANILTAGFEKLGVGYAYDENSTKYKDNWVQMFGGGLTNPDTLSTSEILETPMTLNNGNIPASNSSKLLSGTKSADYLRNGVKGAKISALGGNDTIKNYGASASINAGAGNDSIRNEGASVSISTGTGNDSIENYGSKVSISAGGDKIYNYGDNVSVQAEEGDNLIVNGEFFSKGGVGIKIIAGSGNDTITNSGSKSLLDGGEGNDLIHNLIHNGYYFFEDWNTYYEASYNNEHDDKNKSSSVTINGGAGDDTIDNRGFKVTINAGDGNDSVKNYGSNISIDGGKNNDFIINGGYFEGERGGSQISISGGDGNDTITSHGNNSRLDGGSGNDLIYNGYRYYAPGDAFYDSDSDDYNGNNTTIFGGKGNDTIKNLGNNVVFVYKSGDGKDVIFGFDDKDTLTLDGLNFTSSYKNEVLTLKVDGGSVILKDFTATTFHINSDTYHINSKNKFVK